MHALAWYACIRRFLVTENGKIVGIVKEKNVVKAARLFRKCPTSNLTKNYSRKAEVACSKFKE